jgi:hypothetical protein
MSVDDASFNFLVPIFLKFMYRSLSLSLWVVEMGVWEIEEDEELKIGFG